MGLSNSGCHTTKLKSQVTLRGGRPKTAEVRWKMLEGDMRLPPWRGDSGGLMTDDLKSLFTPSFM